MSRTRPQDPRLRLLSFLIMTRIFEAIDPRDKVYDIMAVASDGMELDLLPDFSKTTEAVYIEVARRILRHTGSFDILRCVETLKHDDTLPNWVPDWRSRRMERFGVEIINQTKHYNATQGLPLEIRDPVDIGKLSLRGLYIASGPVERDQDANLQMLSAMVSGSSEP
jgi:hypothetical protein